MEAFNTKSSSSSSDRLSSKSQVSTAANELLNESKKLAEELYEEGLNKLNEAEQQVKAYSGQLLQRIQEKPLTSILIAGGIGFLLSKLIKK